jgi:hypothetical protein
VNILAGPKFGRARAEVVPCHCQVIHLQPLITRAQASGHTIASGHLLHLTDWPVGAYIPYKENILLSI